ncbi:MAG TPA: EI24 domain-containing protein [Phormidium sp.]
MSNIIHAPVGFVSGATYPFRALVFLSRTPRLWGYVLVPILVNIVAGIGLYVGLLLPGLNGIDGLVATLDARTDALIAGLPAWLSVLDFLDTGLGWLLRFLLVALLLVAIGFLLVQFGVILGSPWYGQLSEQLELSRTGKLPKPEGGVAAIPRDIGRALMFELNKLLLLIQVGLPLLLLNFLPGFGTAIASVGGIVLAATLVCLDFLDAPLERRRLSFKDKLGIIRRSLPASASFALVCLGLISIPLFNLLAVPLCVTSGTLFFCDQIWPSFNEGLENQE